MKKHPIYLIVAVDENFGIGINGHLPWKFKKEYKYFRDTTKKTDDSTKQNMVIMGKNTWASLPPEYRPLPDRKNMVLTSDVTYSVHGAQTVQSIDEALKLADEKNEKIFILGGGQVFAEALKRPDITGIYLTKICHTFECDTFFPVLPKEFDKIKTLGADEENEIRFEYYLYHK